METTPSPPNDRVRKLIAQSDLVAIGVQLTRYAQRRMRYHCAWTGRSIGDKEPEDFAEEAITDTYCGRRCWDPDKKPDLLSFLYDVVESKIRNAVWRKEGAVLMLEDLPTEVSQPAEVCDLLLDLGRELGDEPDLWRIVELYAEGVDRPADLSEHLGLPVGEVHNRRKRLRRRIAGMLGIADAGEGTR